jgi:Na+-transporting methylmalonyl-CoA/oxaloacetate decarboxylase gamma subunit
MKKTILGTLVVFLTLALLIGSLTMIGPIHSSNAAVEHDCITETIEVVDGRIKVIIEGVLVVHDGENHDPRHFFTCLSVL